MSVRNFSNMAVETEITADLDDTATTFEVASLTGYPSPPFTILLDPDKITEEACLVTEVASLTVTATRGYNGTQALSHGIGSKVRHAAVAIDFTESNDHVSSPATHTIVCTSSTRPDPATEGQVIIESDTTQMLVYTSGQWLEVSPTPPATSDGLVSSLFTMGG